MAKLTAKTAKKTVKPKAKAKLTSKAKPKAALTLAKATKPKAKASAPAPKREHKAAQTPARNGFMWKILEQKELERKKRENAEAQVASVNPDDRHSHPGMKSHTPFAKFQGPRRRAS